MDIRGFWRIVDACRRHEAPEEALADKLHALSPDEVAAFDEIFCDRVDDAFTWDVWGAAHLIDGIATDEGFLHFRYGLVAQGRVVFDLALQNPDSLAKVNVTSNAAYGLVALTVYRDLTGRELARAKAGATPRGRAWDFDDVSEQKKRLPKLQRKTAVEAFDELHLRGWEKTRDGDLSGGNALYREALELLDPDDRHDGVPLVHANIMSNARDVGDLATARAHFDVARRLRTRVSDLGQRAILEGQIAWFAYEHGTNEDREEALEWARESSNHATDPLPAMDTEIRLLLALGREGAAKQLAKRALARDPSFASLADLKARWRL